jgi:putative oxidoreductase
VNTSTVNDTAPAIVRLAQGSLMAGHGAQKLFGSFGGHGLEGTSGFWRCWACARDAPGRLWQASPSSGAGPAHGRGTA